jgi:hypothetical protein
LLASGDPPLFSDDDKIRAPLSGHPTWCFDRLVSVCTRISLGLCSPARARNRHQEKQRITVKETDVGNGTTAKSADVERIYVKNSEHPKDQREDSADQA